MTEDEHQLASYRTLPWIPMYSQAATVHTYPGLPPVAELIPEAEGP